MTDKTKIEAAKYVSRIIIFPFLVGLPLFLYGIFSYFYKSPKAAIFESTQMPYMADGSLFLVLGLALVIISFYNNKNRTKLINNRIKRVKQEQKERRKNPNYMKHG